VTAAEFSRPVPVDRIGPGGLDLEIVATEAECAALAVRLGVPAVLALSARFHLRRGTEGRIAATARLAGRLVRDCVVSLEPFETAIAEEFALVFVPAALLGEAIDVTAPADDVPYAGSAIDLGEAVAEQVALSLDPYPRRPDAALPVDDGAVPDSPFAVLAARRPKH
jgi:uncharacterized metal-binding protein YceD (DUF177 family)